MFIPEQGVIDMTFSGPAMILRLEDAAIFAICLYLYSGMNVGWLFFAALFLLPDLFMLGYLLNRRFGAAVYNIGHSYVAPLALGATAWQIDHVGLLAAALIWGSHISFDRMIGYGLKYADGFKSTHLGRL
jgi:hypothetical protein